MTWGFAVVPATTSDQLERTRGALLVALPLDAALLAELSETVRYPLALATAAAVAGLRFEPIADQPALAAVDRNRVLVRVELPAAGPPAGAVLATLDRPIYLATEQTGWLLAGLGLGAALLFGVLLERLVVRRVHGLHDIVHRVGSQGDPRLRAGVSGNDEIAGLGRALNSMLDALARHRAEQDAARRRQERLQEQLVQAQKLEAIGEFAGGVAHDFNNCLTAVSGWLVLLRDELAPGSEARGHAELGLAATEHAAAVGRQLLLYSRQGEPQLERLALGELLSGSLQLLRAGLPPSVELQLISHCADDQVEADRTQLQQLVLNLVRNAADAMDRQGRITVRLDEARLPAADCPGAEALPAGRYLRLAVVDHGPGIAPELRERIFEPFFTTKTAGSGTGLGLAVVRAIAERHRGAVGLSSPPGAGATFFVYLPVRAPEATPATPPEAARSTLAGRRLLLVDDDPRILQVLARALTRAGCDVVTASDGQEAWEQFLRLDGRSFDCVLTDLTMPRIGGMQLGERIFNSRMRVPVILMTAYAAALDPERIRQTGFHALIAKPLNLNQLFRLLATVR